MFRFFKNIYISGVCFGLFCMFLLTNIAKMSSCRKTVTQENSIKVQIIYCMAQPSWLWFCAIYYRKHLLDSTDLSHTNSFAGRLTTVICQILLGFITNVHSSDQVRRKRLCKFKRRTKEHKKVWKYTPITTHVIAEVTRIFHFRTALKHM